MEKKITKIVTAPCSYTPDAPVTVTKRRACGYARVSTDKETQESSFDAQMRHYTEYIKSRPDLEFVGMYSDEGITGTSTKHRDGFNHMVQDALDGKIDLIITKSVSRFARNTVDSLTTIRKLKEAGVEVFFEEQNIYTFDSKGELLITIMSSLAQEEAHNISDNTKWGLRKRFAEGKVRISFSRFLGYDEGPNGEMVVNPEQAETVKKIYKWFLDGFSCYAIGNRLTEMGIKTPAGKDNWCASSVRSILKNEKYKGDALLQKTYIEDFMTKKSVKNDGSKVPQYYVTGNHEAIIDPEVFDLVQVELKKRAESRYRYSGQTIFSSKIVCGDCGGWYSANVWHSNDSRYRKIVYRCSQKYNGDHKCTTPALSEYKIKKIFVTALNRLVKNKDDIVANIETLITSLENTEKIDKRMDELKNKMDLMQEPMQRYVNANSSNMPEYKQKYDELVSEYNAVKKEYDDLQDELENRLARAAKLREFLRGLKSIDGFMEDFDPELWCSMVDRMTVYTKDDIRITFKDGEEVQGV